jgi:hypothetical protein
VAIFSLVRYERFSYKEYIYPWWGEVIGWSMALSSMLIIPLYAIYKIVTTPGSIRNVSVDLLVNDLNVVCKLKKY